MRDNLLRNSVYIDESNGYAMLYAPDNPRAKNNKGLLVKRCILVAEKAIGKYLPKKAVVHHVDENKLNDLPSNLVICEDENYHRLFHRRARIVKAGGNPEIQQLCSTCNVVRNHCWFRKVKGYYSLYRTECTECEAKSALKRLHRKKSLESSAQGSSS